MNTTADANTLDIGHLTHRGRVRDTNEDSVFIDRDLGLFVIADGMGGHNAGEMASHIAVQAVGRTIRRGLVAGMQPEDLMRNSIVTANEMVLALSEEHPGWAEMGTTIVVALLSGYSLVIGHVGDSRAYAVDPDSMRQLTEDHSFVAESIREGLLTVSEARTHKSRHGLTLALGIEDQIEPELTSLHWEKDTCLLLCSDGLNEMLDDREIFAIIKSSANPQQACNNLVERANEKGGTDNISVILACNKTR